MIKQPIISIIIPTKNEEKNIGACLASIKKQTYPQKNIEVIVVDNFSIDKTIDKAKLYTDNAYLKGNERSQQRNYGARLSKGKYLLFIDADMVLTSHVVEEAVSLLEKNNVIISILEKGRGRNFWEKVMAIERTAYLQETEIHAARGFPKKLFEAVDGYDEIMFAGEDWDLTLRCRKKGAFLETIETYIIHNERVQTLSEHFTKEQYYITNIHRFAGKHPKEFAKYASLRYRGWLYAKNIKEFLKHPVLSAALFCYKLFVHLYSRPHWNKKKK